MTVALIAIALVLAGTTGSLVVLAIKYANQSDRIVSVENKGALERIEHALTKGQLERSGFELEQTKRALGATEARANALEEIVAEQLNAHPNTDLPAADWRSRIMRVAQQWAEADRAAHGVPADAPEAVSSEGPAGETGADLSSPSGVAGV